MRDVLPEPAQTPLCCEKCEDEGRLARSSIAHSGRNPPHPVYKCVIYAWYFRPGKRRIGASYVRRWEMQKAFGRFAGLLLMVVAIAALAAGCGGGSSSSSSSGSETTPASESEEPG